MTSRTSSAPARVVAGYVVFSGLWILLSDTVVAALATSPAVMSRCQSVKGLAFVAISAALIFALLKRELEARQAAESVSGESRERFRALFDFSADALFVLSPSGQILDANHTAEQRYGFPREHLLAMTKEALSPERLRDGVAANLRAAVEGQTVFKWIHRRRDGSEFPVEIAATAVDFDGRRCIFSSVRDLSLREAERQQLLKLNRTHSVLSRINRAIVCQRDRQALFEETCRTAVEDGGFRMAWLGLAEPETGIVKPVARAGNSGAYLESLDIVLGDSPRGRGPTGVALARGRRVVCNDLERDPAMASWRNAALDLGFRASAAFPLTVRGRVLGTLNLYSGEAGFFDEDELGLLDELAANVSFALDVMAEEQARRRAEALYHDLVETSQDLIWQCDEQGRYFYLNPAWESVFGYRVEEMLGQPFGKFQTPERAERDSLEFARILREGLVQDYETVHLGADGRERHLVFNAKSMLDASGRSAGTRGTAYDVTKRKDAERAADESQERFRRALENIPDVLVIYDGDLRIRYINEATRRVTGRPVSDFLGKREEELWPPEIYSTYLPALQAAVDTAARQSVQVELELPGVGPRSLEVTCVPLLDEKGQVREVLGITHDLTQQRSAELRIRGLHAKLQRHAGELERRVVERTIQLAEAKERAESADHMKSVFLATMSHELRTPLNSIIGFTGILLQELPGKLNDEQRKQLGMVRASARHLLALINDVLDISKIEAGQFEVACEPFDIADVVEGAAGSVGETARAKGLALTVSVPRDVGRAVGDSRRYGQILLNLLGNALKFTDAGSVELKVTRKGRELVTTVRDTGIGIAKEDRAGLFEPFRQLDQRSSRRYEGTGLGLAISKRLAELMGGRIWCESWPGEGSTFGFTVPGEGSPEAGE